MTGIERLVPLNPLTLNQQINFWCQVDRKGLDDCWLWLAGKTEGGYGRLGFGGQKYIATRISYFLANGKDPGKLFVLHKCNTPACVNPNHLFLGTNQENQQQSYDEGRHDQRGELAPSVKLSDKEVLEIRLNPENLTYSDLAKKFRVVYRTIWNIRTRRTWRHI